VTSTKVDDVWMWFVKQIIEKRREYNYSYSF